jgi:hypothetical protein
VIGAAAGMIGKAIDAAKAAAGIASPSKEFGWIGQQNVAGMVGPMNDTGKVEAAGEKMSDAAVRGASGGPTARGLAAQSDAANENGAAGTGGRGAGISISAPFAPVIQGGAATSEASIRKALTEMYPEHLAMVRRVIREASEGGR